MRTETINIYKINELSENSKQRAIDKFRENYYENGYFWHDEMYKTIRVFCDHFGIEYIQSSVGTNPEARVNYGQIDYDTLNLSGSRLIAFLVNNYSGILFSPKTVYFVINEDGTRRLNVVGGHKFGKYVSKCQIEQYSCSLTGVCFDNDILYPIWQFIHGKDSEGNKLTLSQLNNITFEDLLKDCVAMWEKAVREDCEYQESDEYILEQLEANNCEFTEDGNSI